MVVSSIYIFYHDPFCAIRSISTSWRSPSSVTVVRCVSVVGVANLYPDCHLEGGGGGKASESRVVFLEHRWRSGALAQGLLQSVRRSGGGNLAFRMPAATLEIDTHSGK